MASNVLEIYRYGSMPICKKSISLKNSWNLYFGPYQVLRYLLGVTYQVQDSDSKLQQKKTEYIVHVNRIYCPYAYETIQWTGKQNKTETLPPNNAIHILENKTFTNFPPHVTWFGKKWLNSSRLNSEVL